jgi:hypothetical protein
MRGSGKNIDGILDDYRKQVLRWNDQINLVSRQDTAGRLEGLIHQCRDGWDHLATDGVSNLTGASRLWYFDLGSGAGLPGFVWHVQMAAAGLSVRTLLVEPREKRAWFLERMAHLVGPESLHVLTSRWGEIGKGDLADTIPEPPPSHVLISLKALHLPDSAVLEGLTPFLGAAGSPATPAETEIALLIARFYPPDQEWSEELAGELDIPPAGQLRSTSSGLFKSEGGRVLSPATLPGAGLVLSGYRIQIS